MKIFQLEQAVVKNCEIGERIVVSGTELLFAVVHRNYHQKPNLTSIISLLLFLKPQQPLNKNSKFQIRNFKFSPLPLRPQLVL
jgi:hypothetical protein